MVKCDTNLLQISKKFLYLPEEIKYASVSLSEVINNKTRLEATSFSIEGKAAKNKIENGRFKSENLYPNKNFVQEAFHAPRFKRKYVRKDIKDSVGFLGSSEMLEINPHPKKYLPLSQVKEKNLLVKSNTVLISCSGTIGKTTYASKTLIKHSFSQHIIRLICGEYPGYVYCFLNTSEAQAQIKSLIYGAVIQEIEPEHLERIVIPNPPREIKEKIHNLIIDSFKLRDKSNENIELAERILYEELKLEPITKLRPHYLFESRELKNYELKLSELNGRFDGSYHLPLVKKVEEILTKNSLQVKKLSDPIFTKEIILPGRFTRTYVNKDNGVQFLGGKDLFQLNPYTDKFLSKKVHKNQIEWELKIMENNILTPSRGSIGRVSLAPKHFESKVISDNIIKIIPTNSQVAGYLYCFLNSDYGKLLIKRQIYGSVVDAMEPEMLSEVKIPLLKNQDKQKEINELILKSNKLRYEAYLKEKTAIDLMNEEVIG